MDWGSIATIESFGGVADVGGVMSDLIVWYDRYDVAHAPLVGGKNASLGTLMMADLPVPPGFALTIDAYQDGEILVAPITAPSWAPVFPKIKAGVTDIGGMMSHCAIVCREYGVPAVTGTAFATSQIANGQRIRVDGSAGTVTVLDV